MPAPDPPREAKAHYSTHYDYSSNASETTAWIRISANCARSWIVRTKRRRWMRCLIRRSGGRRRPASCRRWSGRVPRSDPTCSLESGRVVRIAALEAAVDLQLRRGFLPYPCMCMCCAQSYVGPSDSMHAFEDDPRRKERIGGGGEMYRIAGPCLDVCMQIIQVIIIKSSIY